MVFHLHHESVDGLFPEPSVLMVCDSVRLVDEEQFPFRVLEYFLDLLSGLPHIACHQVRPTDFNHLIAGEDSDVEQNVSQKPGNGCFGRARIPDKFHIQYDWHFRPFRHLLLHFGQSEDASHLPLDLRQTDQRFQLRHAVPLLCAGGIETLDDFFVLRKSHLDFFKTSSVHAPHSFQVLVTHLGEFLDAHDAGTPQAGDRPRRQAQLVERCIRAALKYFILRPEVIPRRHFFRSVKEQRRQHAFHAGERGCSGHLLFLLRMLRNLVNAAERQVRERHGKQRPYPQRHQSREAEHHHTVCPSGTVRTCEKPDAYIFVHPQCEKLLKESGAGIFAARYRIFIGAFLLRQQIHRLARAAEALQHRCDFLRGVVMRCRVLRLRPGLLCACSENPRQVFLRRVGMGACKRNAIADAVLSCCDLPSQVLSFRQNCGG